MNPVSLTRGSCFGLRMRQAFRVLPFLAAFFVSSGFAQETQATAGSYRYQYSPGQESNAANISFGTGMLTDGDTYALVSWTGNGSIPYTTLPIAFDLLRDAPLQRVVVHARFPNEYWGISSIEVEVRASADALYQVAAVVNQPGSNWAQLSIPTDGINARYVRIKLRRAHHYVYLGVAEFQFFTSPSSATLQTATDLSLEFGKGLEERATIGNYRYKTETAPTGEPIDDAEIAFGPGAELTDGDPASVTWAGNGTGANNLPIVFDLLRDVPVQRLVLYTSFPDQYYAIQGITVETRASFGETYEKPVSVYPTNNSWTYLDIPLAATTARYVRLTLARADNWKYVALGEVQIFTSPSTLPHQPSTNLAGEFDRETLLVDKYGQFLWTTWPGKITSEAQFVTEKNAEAATLPTAAPAGTDIYGGRIGPNYGPPYFFRLQKISGRWWFITPLGHKFYLNGLCDTAPSAWGYSTAVNKDDNATPRQAFQELPSAATYPFAYTDTGHARVNFILPNLHRKYGANSNYLSTWASVLQRRMWDWGFNANGKWEKLPSTTLQIPFIVDLRPAPGVVRIEWACDPFEPTFDAKVREGIEPKLRSETDGIPFKNNKWVIGLIFENEAGWDLEIIKKVIKLPATRQAKIELVDHLFLNHTTAQLTSAFGFTITAKSHLLNAAPDWPSSLNATGLTFISQEAGPKYWGIVHDAIRDYDPNHLILGGALVPGWRSSFEWETSALPYVNAISLDYYNRNTSWYSTKGYASLAKPVILLEHGLVTTGHGRRPYANATTQTHAERGAYYRHVVENLAVYPNFAGASYYTLFDQPLTGREQGGKGENYNFGLLNQQDQPVTDMVAHVRNTKFPRLYDVHEGTVTPFTYTGGQAFIPGDSPVGGFAAWSAEKGLTGENNGLAQDPDGDGVVNLLEFVFGGDPLVPSVDLLPSLAVDTEGSLLNFSLKRTSESKGKVALVVQYGADLATWNGIDIDAAGAEPDVNGVRVTITGSGSATEDVTVAIPLSLGEDGRVFARLQADPIEL